jgi:transcriptional antiterminator RfaH
MRTDATPAWYVARTKPRAEAFAAANLRSKAIEVFFPRLAPRFARATAHAIEPLFPGYLFARLSLLDQFHVASWTPGVAHLLSGGDGSPAALDESVVESLRERAQDGDVLLPQPAFRAGDPVAIRTGPFAGLLAVIDRPSSGAGRIQILLEVLRRQTRVDLPVSAVVPA